MDEFAGGIGEPVDPDVVPGLERSEPLALLAIAIGAVVGSIGRFLIQRAWPAAPGEMPWSTLAINLGGSFVLPFVVVAAIDAWPRVRLLRPALGTGLLGGFTTFSAFTVEQQQFFSEGKVGAGLAYVFLTTTLCILATAIGLSTARSVWTRWF